MKTTFMCLLLTCWLAVTPAVAVADAPLVSATIEPSQISLGQWAQLTITSSGTSMESISVPEVAGLQFRVVGQSRRLEMINGRTLATTSMILRVTPAVAGIFTIPGITPKSQPLVLRVNPEGNPTPANEPGSGRPPVLSGGVSSSGIHMTADGSAFVRMNLPKRDVYVGESIPVEIEIGMRQGFVTSLNGLPTLTGNDFTLNNLSRKPDRVEKLIDGKPFTVMTWHSVLAPVKPGTFTLSVQSPLTVKIRTRPARDSMIDDMLGDPFLQNIFGATVPKDITVSSPPADLTVLELPQDGRPKDFSGAVGTFKIASDISSTTAGVGDPLTLRLHVTGSGNFDRVDTPMLQNVDQWKTYPPKSTFTPSDPIGFKGEKVFEQPLIASKPGAQSLPELAFSYFDPSTRRYETLHSPTSSVTIAPSLADVKPAATGAPGTSGAPAAAITAPATPTPNPAGPNPAALVAANGATTASPVGLLADHAAPTHGTTTLVPLYLQPRFIALPSLLALLMTGGWLTLRQRTSPQSPSRRRRNTLSKAAAQQLQRMETAARAGNAALFFATARTALQDTFTARWNIKPGEFSPDDARVSDDIRQIFTLADEASYAGRRDLSDLDFAQLTNRVREQLELS